MKIYVSPNCPKCRFLKEALDKKEIEYEVETDLIEIIKYHLHSLPVLEVDNQYMTYENAMIFVSKL